MSKKEIAMVWCIAFQRIYKMPLLPTELHYHTGRILRRLRVMSGFAGLKMPRNGKQDVTGSRECVLNSKKGCAGLVVGRVAPIERKIASGNEPKRNDWERAITSINGFHGIAARSAAPREAGRWAEVVTI